MAVDDRQLRADLPRPSAGFQPPLPLIINIKIAQITSDIMACRFRSLKIPFALKTMLLTHRQHFMDTQNFRKRNSFKRYKVLF